MVKLFIISAISFALGNICWDLFGWEEPRLFYIPLAILLFMGAWCVKHFSSKKGVIVNYFLDYVVLLAAGNVIKQIFYYSYVIKEVNDYVYGILLTVWLIARIIAWEIRRQQFGKK